MSYRVTAPLVLARDHEGKTNHRYHNDVINYLDEEQAAHLLRVGMVEKVDTGEPPGEPAGDGKPAKTANKPDLVAWLVANVAKADGTDYTAEELDGKTKPELWDIIDSVED
jgi:hypothetical protein